ncbi:unnamed protein product, partial [Closterium sp. Yama58-4]
SPAARRSFARGLQWLLFCAMFLNEVEETPPEVVRDPACDALGCEPGGKCEVDGNGERYCKWDSPCGACPTGATCKTVPATNKPSVQVPYCACPEGYNITATQCVA